MLNNASKLTKTYSLTDITFSGVGHIIGACNIYLLPFIIKYAKGTMDGFRFRWSY